MFKNKTVILEVCLYPPVPLFERNPGYVIGIYQLQYSWIGKHDDYVGFTYYSAPVQASCGSWPTQWTQFICKSIYCSLSYTTQGDDDTRPGGDSSSTSNQRVIFRPMYAEKDESDDFRALCQTSYYRQRWWRGIPIVLRLCTLRF